MTHKTQPTALTADAQRLANVADQVRALEPEGSESDVYLTEASKVLRDCAARIAELEALQAAPPAPVAAVPVLYVSPAQLEKHLDLEGAENAEAGRYLPARKTTAGKFTQPLHAIAAAPAQEHATQLAGQGQVYSIDADPEGIRARVADAITGALAFGAQGGNTPPPEHWLTPFWMAARFEAAQINTLREWMNAQPAAAAPAQAQEDARDAELFRAMANAAITEDAAFGECLERLGGDCKTIDDIRAVFDAARAAQGGA